VLDLLAGLENCPRKPVFNGATIRQAFTKTVEEIMSIKESDERLRQIASRVVGRNR
jgi:hypothetical protein